MEKIDREKLKEEFKKKRIRLILRIVGMAVLLGFLFKTGLHYLTFEENLARFRQECRSAKKDEDILEIRKRVEAQGMILEFDPESRNFADQATYLLKPTSIWPRAFSCFIQSKFGKVIK